MILKNSNRNEVLRKEIAQLMFECQAFQAQENFYMVEKLEAKIEEKRKEIIANENKANQN